MVILSNLTEFIKKADTAGNDFRAGGVPVTSADTAWALATARIGGRSVSCLVVDGRLYPLTDLAAALGRSVPGAVVDLFGDWPAFESVLGDLAQAAPSRSRMAVDVASAHLLAPLLYPGKVLCAGANYYDHMAEMGFPDVQKATQRLFFFFKPARHAVVGPGATVEMPRGSQMFDWEIELAVVIGRRARYVGVAQALDYVAGYTIAIDLSARDFNRAPDQFYKFDWVAGKAIDTGCPVGPWIVPAAAIADPQNVGLKLWVNGECKQDSHSSKMIYSVAEQIARASEIMTLDPGDLLLTGTPAGVGVPKGTFLKIGDRIDAEIEHIGRLSVTIGS
jgi:2-keto-4-pentenoate hydratase/2-oxohepta-3-ene-1,7-dioic acid hydratase in catechol pathway